MLTVSTVSIIGTCGRSNKELLNLNVYNKMIERAKYIIEKEFKLDPKNIMLVSGGAAWSDHIVISLYLENYVNQAKLYLPTEFDNITKKYKENNSKYDAGRVSNYYHKLFSDKTKINSLAQIGDSISKGIIIDNSENGFKNRNTKVAESDYMIAFSFSDSNEPTDGGTYDTWTKSKSKNKKHVSIRKL